MTDLQNVMALEAAHGGDFRFQHAGQSYTIVGPAKLTVSQVAVILDTEHIPGIPGMPRWKRDRLFEQWVAHYDLPPLRDLQRLTFLVDRYRNELEVDLQREFRVDLLDTWRQRRWRYLLNLIDHLPRNTWYHQQVLNDPEHAKMLAEAEARQKASSGDDEGGPSGPPLQTWTPEVEALTNLLDAVRGVSHTIAAVNSEKGKQPKPPKPAPRPTSALDRARKLTEFERKRAKHQELTMRLLPHKRPGYVKPEPPEPDPYYLDKNGRLRGPGGRFAKRS